MHKVGKWNGCIADGPKGTHIDFEDSTTKNKAMLLDKKILHVLKLEYIESKWNKRLKK
jgi:hypothetical protein